jgi:hypothetical protein
MLVSVHAPCQERNSDMEGQLIHIGDEEPATAEAKFPVVIANDKGPSFSATTSDVRRHEADVRGGRRNTTGVGGNATTGNDGTSTSSTKRDRFKRHASMDEDRGLHESPASGTDLTKSGELSRKNNYSVTQLVHIGELLLHQKHTLLCQRVSLMWNN